MTRFRQVTSPASGLLRLEWGTTIMHAHNRPEVEASTGRGTAAR
jgi:hypothetical protein